MTVDMEEKKAILAEEEEQSGVLSHRLRHALLLLSIVSVCFVLINEINVLPEYGDVEQVVSAGEEDVVRVYFFHSGEDYRTIAYNDLDLFRMTFRQEYFNGRVELRVVDSQQLPEEDPLRQFGTLEDTVLISYKDKFARFARAGRTRYIYLASEQIRLFLSEK